MISWPFPKSPSLFPSLADLWFPSSEGVTKSKQLRSSITIASKSIYIVASFKWYASRAFFKTSGSKCAPGKERSLRFHYVGIWAKILLSLWISAWDLPPVVQNTQVLPRRRPPHLFILPLQTQTHPSHTKNTQYYCPSRPAGEEMMASTNINDNQRLHEAKRHNRSSWSTSSSSTAPRMCNYRCLEKCVYR